MSICVFGAGAVGSVLGGMLAKAGEDITLICRKPHADAINKEGLLVGGVSPFRVRVKATTKPDVKGYDFVFLCVKSYDTKKVCRYLKNADGTIVSFQNGIRNPEIIKKNAGKECISAIIEFNAIFEKPGKVNLANSGEIVIGSPFGGKSWELQKLLKILRKAFNARIDPDIVKCLWGKLIVNSLNVLPAIANCDYLTSMNNEDFRKCALGLINESKLVLEKAGIGYKYPTFGLNIFVHMLYMPQPIVSAALIFNKSKIIPSTLQDIIRRKKTEVDYINGEIIKLGKKLNVKTPLNNKIVDIIKKYEKGRLHSMDYSQIRQILGL